MNKNQINAFLVLMITIMILAFFASITIINIIEGLRTWCAEYQCEKFLMSIRHIVILIFLLAIVIAGILFISRRLHRLQLTEGKRRKKNKRKA